MKPPELNDLIEDDQPVTRAQFDSDCPGCGDAIYEGDGIVLIDGEWVCEAWCAS